MKRFFCFIISLFIVLLSVSSYAAQTEGEFLGFYWKYDKGTLYISGEGELTGDGPWSSYLGKATALDFSGTDMTINQSFQDAKKLKTIHFGEGVIKSYLGVSDAIKKLKVIIDDNSFQAVEWYWYISDVEYVFGENVDSYVIEDGFLLNKEKDYLYQYVGKEKKVIVPASVKTIGSNAFANKKINEIILPDGLNKIGSYNFAYNSALDHLTIPESVTSICSGIVNGCTKLKSYNITNLYPEYSEIYDNPDRYDGLHSLDYLIVPAYPNVKDIQFSYSNSKAKYIIIPEGSTACLPLDSANKDLIAVYLPKSFENFFQLNVSGVKFYVVAGSEAHNYVQKNGLFYKTVTPIKRVELSAETLNLKPKKTETLTAVIQPKDATSKEVQWFSSNELVATVKDGKVTAVGEGECDIYCRGLDCGMKTAICHVTVTK